MRLRLSTPLPPGSHQITTLIALVERMAARTGGAVAIELLDGPAATAEAEVMDALAAGRIEMAIINVSALSARVPALEFVHQPFVLNTDALAQAVTDPRHAIRPILDAAILTRTALRPLWWLSLGHKVMLSKGIDATDFSNVLGRTVRTSSPASGAFLRTCGANTVVLPADQQHAALATGDAHYALTAIGAVRSNNLWQVADTVTRLRSAPFEFVAVIDDRVWQRLPQAQQIALLQLSLEVERELRDQFSQVEQAEYAFARQKGLRVLDLRPDQLADWRLCTWPMSEAFLERTGDVGYQLMAAYGRLRTDPCCNAGPALAPGRTTDAVLRSQ